MSVKPDVPLIMPSLEGVTPAEEEANRKAKILGHVVVDGKGQPVKDRKALEALAQKLRGEK